MKIGNLVPAVGHGASAVLLSPERKWNGLYELEHADVLAWDGKVRVLFVTSWDGTGLPNDWRPGKRPSQTFESGTSLGLSAALVGVVLSAWGGGRRSPIRWSIDREMKLTRSDRFRAVIAWRGATAVAVVAPTKQQKLSSGARGR